MRTSIPILLLSTSLLTHALPQETHIITIAAPKPTNEPSYKNDDTFQKDILNSTNFFRSQHNASSLSWNTSLATFATSYSQKCKWEHSGQPMGENLAAAYNNITAAIDGWGNERKLYNFKDGEFSHETGHFTQLVWRNTTTVGCGRKFCDGENGVQGWFLVCEYYPQGNVETQFVDNVKSQSSGKVDCILGAECPSGAEGLVTLLGMKGVGVAIGAALVALL